MIEIMSNGLTRGKVAKNILLVLVLFIFILTILPQNALGEENKQVNASEILGNITRGEPVEYTDCIIIGDLNISKINLSTIKVGGKNLKIVNSSFSIKNSTVKGNVNFQNCYFTKSVNFAETTFCKEANFEYSIFCDSARFENASFDGRAKFSDVNFNHTIFWNTTFNREAYFSDTKFYDWVQFTKAHFNKKADFNRVLFNHGVDLTNVHFENKTEFCFASFNHHYQLSSTFNGTTEFHSAVFNDVALLGYNHFNDQVSFYNATFNDRASFSRNKFYGKADFDHAKFNDEVEFEDIKFNENALFCDTTFTGLADFEDVRFMKNADFSNAEFNNEAKFTDTTFNGYANFIHASFNKADFEFANFINTVNFNNTDFSGEAHFQNAHFYDTVYFILAKFKDRAYFTDASFDANVDFSDADIFLTMKIRWSQLEGKLVYDGYFYQSLIRNFEALGQSEDANDAYYKYHVEKRKHIDIKSTRGLIRRPLEFIFLDLFCGYGVKPWWTVCTAICIIGVFSFFYWLIEVEGRWKRFWKFLKDLEKRLREFVDRLIKGKENKKSSSDSSLKDRCKRYRKRFLGFVFLSVSIFTTLGLLNNWKTAEDHETWFHFLAIMEALLGWLIMALFVISLTMTWIR